MLKKEVFQKRLRDLMEENDETIYSLGVHLGLSPSTLSRYLTGGMSPKLTAIESLAIKFGVDPVWLAGGDVDKHSKGTVSKRLPVLGKIYTNGHAPIMKGVVPVVGRIIKNTPEVVYEELDQFEFIPYGQPGDFCFLVADDSMSGARIFKEDLAIIKKTGKVENGAVMLVVLDDESAVLRRVFQDESFLVVHSTDPTSADVALYKKDLNRLKILGRVVAVKFTI